MISEGSAYYFGNDIAAIAQDDDNDTKIMMEKNTDEDKIRFDTASNERMIIDSVGNVGVGINIVSTTSRMHVAGGASQYAPLKISRNSAANSALQYQNDEGRFYAGLSANEAFGVGTDP